VYIWEIPGDWADQTNLVTVDRAFMVLQGHRSIVNQVRFNSANHMLISAGVEKILKVGGFIECDFFFRNILLHKYWFKQLKGLVHKRLSETSKMVSKLREFPQKKS